MKYFWGDNKTQDYNDCFLKTRQKILIKKLCMKGKVKADLGAQMKGQKCLTKYNTQGKKPFYWGREV